MRISIPKEIKSQEGRVALLPNHVKTLIEHDHQVYIGYDAGACFGCQQRGLY
ncbi:MAG: hypothetical protein ACWIPH_00280 [Ostreibacterium sp.]